MDPLAMPEREGGRDVSWVVEDGCRRQQGKEARESFELTNLVPSSLSTTTLRHASLTRTPLSSIARSIIKSDPCLYDCQADPRVEVTSVQGWPERRLCADHGSPAPGSSRPR